MGIGLVVVVLASIQGLSVVVDLSQTSDALVLIQV